MCKLHLNVPSKKPDQQHAEVGPGWDTRAALPLYIERLAQILHEAVEAVGRQHLIQALVEIVARRSWQRRRRDEQAVLLRSLINRILPSINGFQRAVRGGCVALAS